MKRKYIAPGSWFSLEYPADWRECEDIENTFLFYNPDRWTGNFRISADMGATDHYATDCMRDELRQVPGAKEASVGPWHCVCSSETFQENGEWYTTVIWLTGHRNISVECSFTVPKGESIRPAEDIIKSLHIRQKGDKPLREIIPVRVLEINTINENFDWAVTAIKKTLTKDFTSSEGDIANLQKIIDDSRLDLKQKQVWTAFGFAFASILFNEIDGMEWVTVVDGEREYPALRFRNTDVQVVPSELLWNKIRRGEPCNLMAEYQRIRAEVEQVL